MRASSKRIQTFVDWFIRSDYLQTWISESVESGSYSRNQDKRDRYDRCCDAAEDGADGSTHAEVIEDWRDAFDSWLRDRSRRNRRNSGNRPERFEAAVLAHFNDVETWHASHGSLHQQIG